MRNADERDQEIAALRDRLPSLTEAILRISEDLDLDTVLHEVVDSARPLTDARFGGITTGLGSDELRRLRAGAHRREEPPTQAGRRCRQSHLHLQRASRRLPDAQGRDAGTGGAVSVGIVIDGTGVASAHAVPS